MIDAIENRRTKMPLTLLRRAWVMALIGVVTAMIAIEVAMAMCVEAAASKPRRVEKNDDEQRADDDPAADAQQAGEKSRRECRLGRNGRIPPPLKRAALDCPNGR